MIEREEFHQDEEPSARDAEIGHTIAYVIGDTFIDSTTQSSSTQWAIIVHALRFHGLIIVRDIFQVNP